MGLKEFMEKFLPNCEERRKEAETVGQCLYFYHRNFPEALRNFVQAIIEDGFKTVIEQKNNTTTCTKTIEL
jgi:hypothetical protein